MVASLGIFAFDYGVIYADKGSISFGFVSIGDIEVQKPEIIVAIVVSLILISLYVHVVEYFRECRLQFKKGYQGNKMLCESLQSFLASNVGHDNVGCPTGLNPSLKNKPIPLGIYIKVDGNQTPNLSYMIPGRIHLNCVLSGVWSAIISRSILVLFFGVAIGLLAAWLAIT